MDSFHMSDAEKDEIWRLTRQGLPVRMVCRRIGRASGSVRGYLARSGGVRPAVRRRAPDRLTLSRAGGDFRWTRRRFVVAGHRGRPGPGTVDGVAGSRRQRRPKRLSPNAGGRRGVAAGLPA